MATTHVFIVDSTTFDVHLKYMFAGTGAKQLSADILLSQSDNIKKEERLLAGLAADAARIRPGDYVLFYLQQNKKQGIEEGQLFGIFQAKSRAFIDSKGECLKNFLGKKLTFRVLIEPYKVYAKGVSEWNLLDNIEDIKYPKQMIWSLIYRKLRGNRGNTMITLLETKRIFSLLDKQNNSNVLTGKGFCWDSENKQIKTGKYSKYPNFKKTLDVKPRLIAKYVGSKRSFENLLQAFIVGDIENLLKDILFKGQNIDWIGNEVSCGVGMQRIDILVQSHDGKGNSYIYPIELKDEPIKKDIFKQIDRYIAWLRLYYKKDKKQKIIPVIISAAPVNQRSKYAPTSSNFEDFNQKHRKECGELRYITFSPDKMLKFKEIDYKKL